MYCTRENFCRGKIGEFGESSAIHQNFLRQYSQIATLKMYLAYVANDFNLFTKFFLANSFHLYSSPKFSPTKILPRTVCCKH